jgi:hypothetical protein
MGLGDDGGRDGGALDAGFDGGPIDGGPVDGGPVDGGPVDADAHDASRSDAGSDGGGPLVVFVTSSTFEGDFGGILAGDFRCNAAALSAGLSGVFVAWLSSGAGDARDRVTGAGPWHSPSGTLHFSNRSHLLGLAAPVNRTFETESGAPLPSDTFAWTGTRAEGTVSSDTCNSWMSRSASGIGGYPNDESKSWTDEMTHGCGNAYRLYCFENR